MTQDDLSSRNRQNLDRATASRLDRQYQQEQRDHLTPLPAQAAGFNSRGELETQRPGHGAIPVRSVNTNGAIGIGQTVRQRGDRVDAMPRVRTSEPVASSVRMVEVAYLFQPELFYYGTPEPPYLNERQRSMFSVVINGQEQDNSVSTHPNSRDDPSTDIPNRGFNGLTWQPLSLPVEIEFNHFDCLAGFDSSSQPDSLPSVFLTRIFIRSQNRIDLNGTALIEPDYQIAQPAFVDFRLVAVAQRYTGEVLEDENLGLVSVRMAVSAEGVYFEQPQSEALTLEAFEEPSRNVPAENNVIIIDCWRGFSPGFTGIGKLRFE